MTEQEQEEFNEEIQKAIEEFNRQSLSDWHLNTFHSIILHMDHLLAEATA